MFRSVTAKGHVLLHLHRTGVNVRRLVVLLQLFGAGEVLHAGGAEEALGASSRHRHPFLIGRGDRHGPSPVHLPASSSVTTRHGTTRRSTIRHGTARHSTVGHDTIRLTTHDTAGYDGGRSFGPTIHVGQRSHWPEFEVSLSS